MRYLIERHMKQRREAAGMPKVDVTEAEAERMLGDSPLKKTHIALMRLGSRIAVDGRLVGLKTETSDE